MTLPQFSAQRRLRDANEYLAKHQLFKDEEVVGPAKDLRMAVVIPVHCEEVVEPIQSLLNNSPPGFSIEIIVVVNAGLSATSDTRRLNHQTANVLRTLSAGSMPDWARLIVLEFNELPDRHAGVGLARKIGMDIAVERFCKRSIADGLIVSLDADCIVSKEYLVSIDRFFDAHPQCPAGTIYFEHRVTGLSQSQVMAVNQYELFLRYYVQGLKEAGYPAAFHTVGSCFAARVDSYVRRGGMSRRTAAEDFYFLHKLRVLGSIPTIPDCTVYPEGRLSSRTPFGTGQGVQKIMAGEFTTYSPEVFTMLRHVMVDVERLYNLDPGDLVWPDVLKAYFAKDPVKSGLSLIRHNTASQESFKKRFFQWFDGLRVLQLVREMAQTCPNVSLERGAHALLAQRAVPTEYPALPTTSGLLEVYRALQRA